jgi:hypothetical protein
MSLEVIDDMINQTINENSSKLFREVIQKIHPDINTYTNSINILVGKQGLGKSYTALREIIKISYVDTTTHLLLVINKSGSSNDATFNVLQKCFRIPFVFLKYDDAEIYVRNLLKYKDLYNKIKNEHLENLIEDDQIKELFEVLYINSFNIPFLSTIIYFEDCANNKLFKKPSMYFPQLIATCRHNGLTFFFATQFWKGVPTELKSNATTIYIFRDFSRQQFLYILQQTPLKYEVRKICETYQKLKNHDKMIVDTIKGVIILDQT